MARLYQKKIGDKKYWVIFWYDPQDNNKRKEIRCEANGATNADMRKRLLNIYIQKELKAKQDVLLGITEPKEKNFYEMISEYVSHRKKLVESGNLSKNVCTTNLFNISYFENFCKDNKIKMTKDITVEFLFKYRSFIENRTDLKNVSKNSYLKDVKTMFNHFKFSDYFETQKLISALKFFKIEHDYPFCFSIEELQKIFIEAIKNDREKCKITRKSKKIGKFYNGEMPKKYISIIPLLLLITLTGMRVSDALSLKWCDVLLDNGIIKYRAKKNRKICIIPIINNQFIDISPLFWKIIEKWYNNKIDDFVLPHEKSEIPCVPKHSLERLRKSLGFHFNLQKLRKNFISYAVSAGVPPAVVAFWVGHSPAVAEKHYLTYAIGMLKGKSLDEMMGLKEILQSLLRHKD